MSETKIYKAIVGVMSEIGAIGKEKINQQQGFKYRGIDDVMNALQPILVKHGVFVVPEILEQIREERTTRNGGVLIYSICKIKYTFFADDGSFVSALTIGEGMDSGDKSTNKAMATAFKYACFQVFCIPTAELKDPECESHELNPRQPLHSFNDSNLISKQQAKRMFAISKGNADLCREVLHKFGYDKSENVKKTDYESICAEIEQRIGALDTPHG